MDPNEAPPTTEQLLTFGYWHHTIMEYGWRIFIIFVIFIIVHYVVRVALGRLEKQMSGIVVAKSDLPGEAEKRMKTLFGIFRKSSIIILWLVAVLVILNTLRIQIGPIIAAAGILGLAVSFGAQSLVKDLISGTFIIFENQIRVGDVAIINGTGGLVEEINLRTVILRDLEGVVHIFPSGNITSLSNMTKDWSAALMNIGVAYKENTDRVVELMLKVAQEMREDETYGPMMIADMEVFGVDSFADSAVYIKARLKTLPIQQWAVAREYRRRIKLLFDEEGVEIPFPHRTLYFGEASQAFKLLMERRAEVSNRTAEAEERPL